jgi:hypothetical protein
MRPPEAVSKNGGLQNTNSWRYYGKFCMSPWRKHPLPSGRGESVFRFSVPVSLRPFFTVTLLALTTSLAWAAEGTKPAVTEALPEPGIDWAKEQQFWSFRAPEAKALPAVKNKKWPAQPVDYFVLARLEQKNLSPAPEAEKRALIRRLTFDLTGLPPMPDEVEAFVKDKRADAYQRLVERLLASSRFGERLASLWLPLARFAEDQAHQVGTDTKYFYPNAHRYREWVINAFNRDLPYDQFLKLQLAADKLPNAQEDLPALGFLGLGPKYYNRNRIEVMADEWEDRVDTVARTMLGLTVACARCHDHKFEPITQTDYYALAGVFASTKMVNKAPDGSAEKNDTTADKMNAGTLHMVEDGDVQNLNVFVRGNVERKGPVTERRFLRVLSQGEPVPFKEGSGRAELAAAIASNANPLTARVMVNRVWGLVFGQPLAATPSNLGHSGTLPVNQELLDDLAVRFMERGWSVKKLVRELVLSATYRQSSRDDAAKIAADAPNESLSHMSRRRLSIEQWRDAVLFASGELEESSEAKSFDVSDPENHHRTIYSRVSRLKLNDLLAQFDYPDANVHAEKRSTTSTPTQKLFLMNSPFMMARAKALAARLTADAKESDKARVEKAYRILFSREAERGEVKLALDFLGKPGAPEMSRWEQYAQLLLASNEMMYVD